VDEKEKSSSCVGGEGADGSTVDDDGLATTITVGDDGVATITNGVALVGTGGDTVVDDVDGAAVAVVSVDGGIMIPLLADDADGATVDGRVSVDDINCVSVDKGSVDSAGGAAIDDVILVGQRCGWCIRRR